MRCLLALMHLGIPEGKRWSMADSRANPVLRIRPEGSINLPSKYTPTVFWSTAVCSWCQKRGHVFFSSSTSGRPEAFEVLFGVSSLPDITAKDHTAAITYLLPEIVQFIGSGRIPRPVSFLQLQTLHRVRRESVF